MTTKAIDRLDTFASSILLIWVGMALCVNLFVIPLIFKHANSYELAELMISKVVTWLDVAAWIVFLLALLFVKGTRFVIGITDAEPIGYMRLWVAAAMLALLICFTSTFIVAPKLCAVRGHVGIAMEVDNINFNDDSLSHKKAIKISRQLTWLRLVVALSMTTGVSMLPRRL